MARRDCGRALPRTAPPRSPRKPTPSPRTTGPSLLSPPSSPGMPEYLYGSPVIEDPGIPVHGSAVKSVVYADWNSYYLIHQGGGLRWEISRDYAFANDLWTYRAILRLDGK